MKRPSVRSIALAILAAVGAAGACSESTASVSSNCLPGSTRQCDIDSGCTVATQECRGDPPTWTDCRCLFTTPTDSGAPAPPVESSLPLVGRACRSDRECDPGTYCLTRSSNDFFGGGPPNGVCVADCSADATVCRHFVDATCVRVAPSVSVADASSGGGSHDAALDSGDATISIPNAPGDAGGDASTIPSDGSADARRDASALPDAAVPGARDAAPATRPDATVTGVRDAAPSYTPTSLCMQRCTLGPGALSKCYGVSHVACAPLPSGSGSEGYCRPLCQTDADCATPGNGPNRTCDLHSSVCVAAPARSDDFLGKTCDSGTAVFCNGECLGIGTATSICTHACVLGAPLDCAGPQAGTFAGACLETPQGRGTGDVGYCRKLCDCPKDCGAANLVCAAFENPALASGFNRRGVCTPDSLASGKTLNCTPDRDQ